MKQSEKINAWLISEGRLLGKDAAIVEGYAKCLIAAGVPLARANIAHVFANPLLVATGTIWTPEGSEVYDVTHAMLETQSYVGSPFEHVQISNEPLHKSLLNLDPEKEHSAYLELAGAGGTDLFATYLAFGDGSRNGCTYVSDDPNGFSDEDVELILDTRVGLASALEPVAMRLSTESLLRTYIGVGPAKSVVDGTIMRGEHAAIEAVVMFTDLRGFTAKSEQWGATRLLKALNGYFDCVVQSVEENGGDVLKFMGDGILSIFAIDADNSAEVQCRNAVNASIAVLDSIHRLNQERRKENEEPLALGVGINSGSVTYGNIGSPGRLDFTVLGSAVNIASRVQDLSKTLDHPVLATSNIFTVVPELFDNLGEQSVRGLAAPIEVFALKK